VNKILFTIVISLLIVGCASTPTKGPRDIVAEAGTIFQATDFMYMIIPSHGAIADGVSIAAKGAGNAKRLASDLERLSQTGNGKIVVSGANSSLVKAVIEGAAEERSFPDVWLIYAGDEKHTTELQKTVENSGMKYSFINIEKE
jgi:hypothetical protein